MTGPMLRVQELSVRRGARAILSGVTFEVFAGEMWAILGPNGCGKSSLLETLVAALPCGGGSIELIDRPLLGYSARERARHLGYLGQGASFPRGLRVRDLVAFGRIPHHTGFSSDTANDARIVETSMVAANVAAMAEHDVSRLSSGEQARVALARVLAQESPLLLLDEPTAHLDIGVKLDLLSKLRGLLNNGSAIVVVMHDLELAVRFCTHAVVLHAGSMVATGPIEEALSTALLQSVFGVRAHLHRDRGRVTGLHMELADYILPGEVNAWVSSSL